MDKKGDVFWYLIGAILALMVLVVLLVAGVVKIPSLLGKTDDVSNDFVNSVCYCKYTESR